MSNKKESATVPKSEIISELNKAKALVTTHGADVPDIFPDESVYN